VVKAAAWPARAAAPKHGNITFFSYYIFLVIITIGSLKKLCSI
jgi:hypothetical protein